MIGICEAIGACVVSISRGLQKPGRIFNSSDDWTFPVVDSERVSGQEIEAPLNARFVFGISE